MFWLISCLLAFQIQGPVLTAPEDAPLSFEYVNTARFNLDAMEQELSASVNGARRARGLPAYEPSPRLWYKAKNHTRRMALDQHLESVDLKELTGGPAAADPLTFWAGTGGLTAKAAGPSALSHVVNDWLCDAEARAILLTPQYNRSAVAVSVDRAGFLYIAMIAGEEVYPERDLRRLDHRVFEAINAVRRRRGLPALTLLEPLTRTAQAHSEHMALRHLVSHTDVMGKDAVARLRAIGFSQWQSCAENIASNRGFRDPVQAAVDGWLKSPSHAAVLLRRDFTHTGIGVARSLDDTYYFTQLFIKDSRPSP